MQRSQPSLALETNHQNQEKRNGNYSTKFSEENFEFACLGCCCLSGDPSPDRGSSSSGNRTVRAQSAAGNAQWRYALSHARTHQRENLSHWARRIPYRETTVV